MKTAIDSAIKLLAEKIAGDIKAADALNYTQAALNLAHVLMVQESTKHVH